MNIFCGKVERGSEIWTQSLARILGKKHQIDVFQTGENIGANYQIIIIRHVPAIKTGIFYHLNVFWFTLLCLPRLFQKKYDWLIPVNGRLQILLTRIVRIITGTRILIVGHAGVGREDKINILFGRPDKFVALSGKAYSWAQKYAGKRTEVFRINNGIDFNLFNPKAKTVKINLARPRVLCVAELLPYKRITNLINAVAQTDKFNLLLIGKGILEKEVDALGKKLLDKRYKRIPSVTHSLLPDYYRSCDLFSLPSRESEAFGLVYLEALSSNLPIVAPDDLNRRDIIGDAGLFVDVENINEYASALISVSRHNFGSIPRNRAEKFSWDKIALLYEEILLNHQN